MEFANRGFDGTTTRAIAAGADVNPALIAHHFGSKDKLWQAVAEHLVGMGNQRIRVRRKGLDGVDRRPLIRLLLRELIVMSAEVPEFSRFMMQANLGDKARLEWLVSRFLQPGDEAEVPIIAEAQKLGLMPAGDPLHVRILFMSAASSIFTFAAQYELLTGSAVTDPDVIERHIDLVLGCFESGGAASS